MSTKAPVSSKSTPKTGLKTGQTGVNPVSSKTSESPIHLTEDDKKADPDNYIFNPGSQKYVKRESPKGKALEKAEKEGIEIQKTMTETDRLILVVKTFQESLELDDSEIKETMKDIVESLPRNFPAEWGGKHKTPIEGFPKGACSAYIFYTTANREVFKKKNPEVSNKQLTSLMAKSWKSMSEPEKALYNKLAEEDRERYRTEREKFDIEHPERARKKTSANKPTKVTAYQMFCKEQREKVKEDNPDSDSKEIGTILSDTWEDIKNNEDLYKEFQDLANEENKNFSEKMRKYVNSPDFRLSKSEQEKQDKGGYEIDMETGRLRRIKEEKVTTKTPTAAVVKPKKATSARAKKATVQPKVEEPDFSETSMDA